MNKEEWKSVVISEMQASGVYKEKLYDSIIDALAGLLSHRDKVYAEFLESGGESCIVKTLDRGNKNLAPNPYLKIWLELNETALSYWRECMISPAALRKATAAQAQAQHAASFEELLAKIV